MVRIASSRRSRPAFVLGLGPNGYGFVRSLERAGIPVVAFYHGLEHYGRHSRLAECHSIDGTLPVKEIVKAIIEHGNRHTVKPILLAATDEFAALVAEFSAELQEHFELHVIPREIATMVFDKSMMTKTCEAVGILIPKTHVTAVGEDIQSAAAGFQWPCIIKPVRSFRTSFPHGTKNHVAQSAEELGAYYDAHPELIGETLWQEMVPGGDNEIVQCNILMSQAGDRHDVCSVRKLRQFPVGTGNMCFGRTETLEPLADETLKLLHYMKYRGLASLEFKRNPSDDRYYFIEMNARLPWYCSLFEQAGVSLPLLAYQDLAGEDSTERAPYKQRDGVHWMNARADVKSCLLGDRRTLANVASWLRCVARTDAFAWWTLKDPAPFVHSLRQWLQR